MNSFGDFLYRFILADDRFLQIFAHGDELFALALSYPFDRDTRHHGDHLCDILLVHWVALGLGLLFPLRLSELQLAQQFAFAVAQVGGAFILLAFDRLVLELLEVFDLLFQFLDMFRDMDIFEVYASAHFVEHINSFVRQEAVGDIAVTELDAGPDSFIRVGDIMELLVFRLDVVQDIDGFLGGGGIHHHLLEAAVQCTVFFDVLAVLVER